MNHITYRISLDLRKTDSGVVVKVKRDDTVKKLAISLTDGGKPYHITEDCSAVFAGEKPDGTILCNDCVIEDCVVTYEITPQTIAELGEVESEIRLYSTDGDLATSPSFTILVVPPVYDDDRVIESFDEVNALTELITSAEDTIQKGEEVIQEGNELFANLQEKGEALEARTEEAIDDLKATQEELVAEAREVFGSMPTTYVSFDPQNPTAEEAAQARENIGALSEDDLHPISDIIRDLEDVVRKSVSFEAQQLTDEQKSQARSNIDAAGGNEVVKTYQQDLTHQQMDTARYNINAASADQVVRVDTAQNLSEERKAQARENIGAVGTAEHTDLLGIVQDLERRTDETVQGIEDAVTNTTIKKNAEASVSSIKILHSPETSDAIFAEGTTVWDKDGLLVNALTLRGDFDGGIDNDSVILRNVHAGEEPTDAVNLAQLNEAVGKQKVYEHIATITVAPDTDGNLPQHVIFSADSDGNPFELTDFVIRAKATFSDWSKSSLYMTVNNGYSVFSNSKITGMTASLLKFTIFVRQESDGFIRAEHTEVSYASGFYDPSTIIRESRLISPMSGLNILPTKQIDLHTLVGDTKAWAEGSTFELWGVRV